jgi:hypothetical protein
VQTAADPHGTVGLWLLGFQARAAAILSDAETALVANEQEPFRPLEGRAPDLLRCGTAAGLLAQSTPEIADLRVMANAQLRASKAGGSPDTRSAGGVPSGRQKVDGELETHLGAERKQGHEQ